MVLYILEWNYNDPYEFASEILGCYSSASKAEDAYNIWYAEQPEQSDYYRMNITHTTLNERIL